MADSAQKDCVLRGQPPTWCVEEAQGFVPIASLNEKGREHQKPVIDQNSYLIRPAHNRSLPIRKPLFLEVNTSVSR
jgi:hypothetical protein